jgi:hypothetical protein
VGFSHYSKKEHARWKARYKHLRERYERLADRP